MTITQKDENTYTETEEIETDFTIESIDIEISMAEQRIGRMNNELETTQTLIDKLKAKKVIALAIK